MSIPYRQILRMAARRVNAVTGTTHALMETAYVTSPLTTTQIGNTNFNFSFLKDMMVGVVGEIVSAYTSVHNHPFRSFNIGVTSSLANKAQLPSLSSASKPIVGTFGAIRDASNGEICTKAPIQLIRTIVDNTDSVLKESYYLYDILGDRLVHTRTNVVMDVCVFSVSDQLTAVGANGDAPIPDALLMMAADGMCKSLIVDDDFVAQAGVFSNYYTAGLQILRGGGTTYVPAPVDESSLSPVAS